VLIRGDGELPVGRSVTWPAGLLRARRPSPTFATILASHSLARADDRRTSRPYARPVDLNSFTAFDRCVSILRPRCQKGRGSSVGEPLAHKVFM
jgi:hypothetical protein